MLKISKEEFQSFSSRRRATFINSVSGFRSLFLVGTKSLTGIDNLAPFNSIVHIGSNPAYLGCIARPKSDEHQTLLNIEETKFFTLNSVSKEMVERAHQCSAKYSATESEFDQVGFDRAASAGIAPYVSGSPIQISLSLASIIPIPLNGTSLVIGAVEEIILNGIEIEPDGFVNLEALGTLTCIGLDSYHTTEQLVRLPYAETKK